MSESLKEIKNAIDTFDVDRARALLRTELVSNPSAEAYYLASQVALNDEKRATFLEKASQLDPFHPKVVSALTKLKSGSQAPVTISPALQSSLAGTMQPGDNLSITTRVSSPTSTSKRPTGITVLGILACIGGPVSVLIGLGIASASSSLVALGLLNVISGSVGFFYSIGLLRLKSWGWKLARFGVILSMLFGFLNVFLSRDIVGSSNLGSSIGGFLVGVFINILILKYLSQSSIKRVFNML